MKFFIISLYTLLSAQVVFAALVCKIKLNVSAMNESAKIKKDVVKFVGKKTDLLRFPVEMDGHPTP